MFNAWSHTTLVLPVHARAHKHIKCASTARHACAVHFDYTLSIKHIADIRDRLAPTAENIESAMYKVEWMQDVADRLSPENVIAGEWQPY